MPGVHVLQGKPVAGGTDWLRLAETGRDWLTLAETGGKVELKQLVPPAAVRPALLLVTDTTDN